MRPQGQEKTHHFQGEAQRGSANVRNWLHEEHPANWLMVVPQVAWHGRLCLEKHIVAEPTVAKGSLDGRGGNLQSGAQAQPPDFSGPLIDLSDVFADCGRHLLLRRGPSPDRLQQQ